MPKFLGCHFFGRKFIHRVGAFLFSIEIKNLRVVSKQSRLVTRRRMFLFNLVVHWSTLESNKQFQYYPGIHDKNGFMSFTKPVFKVLKQMIFMLFCRKNLNSKFIKHFQINIFWDAVVWTCWYTIGRCMNVLVQYWTLLNSFCFNNSLFLSEFLAHLDLPCIYIHCLTRYQKKLMRKIYPLYTVSVITFFKIQW